MLPVNPGEEFRPRDEEAKADSIRAMQQDKDDMNTDKPIPTPSIPTPRTDAAKFARQQWASRNLSAQLRGSHLDYNDPEPPDGFKVARQLEAELATTLASLAAAQSALRDCHPADIWDRARMYYQSPKQPDGGKNVIFEWHDQRCVQVNIALADNCANPWLARYDAMRVALGATTGRLEWAIQFIGALEATNGVTKNGRLFLLRYDKTNWHSADEWMPSANEGVDIARKALKDEPK